MFAAWTVEDWCYGVIRAIVLEDSLCLLHGLWVPSSCTTDGDGATEAVESAAGLVGISIGISIGIAAVGTLAAVNPKGPNGS